MSEGFLHSCFKYQHGFETLHGTANNARFPYEFPQI